MNLMRERFGNIGCRYYLIYRIMIIEYILFVSFLGSIVSSELLLYCPQNNFQKCLFTYLRINYIYSLAMVGILLMGLL